MEYLSQPFKLNNSGLESTITVSMRLVFMKICDNASKENTNKKMISKEDSINQVNGEMLIHLILTTQFPDSII